MRGVRPAAAVLLALCLAAPARAHVILDPDLVHRMVVEIARDDRQSREETPAGAEALFRLGEKAQALVDLLNQDLLSHGKSDLLAQLVVKRLETYRVRVAFSEREQRFAYDLAAFRAYLDRAPRGAHAADARYGLIARTFYATLGPDPARLVDADAAAVAAAAREEERFLRDYPGDARARQVRFFLGVDYYRLSRNVPAPERAREYRRLARRTLADLQARHPGTVEARAAEALLEGLGRAGED